MGICYVCCVALLLIIRYVLSTENKRRDQEKLDDSYDDVYIEKMGKDGQVERLKVDKVNHIMLTMRILAYSVNVCLGIPGSYRYPES